MKIMFAMKAQKERRDEGRGLDRHVKIFENERQGERTTVWDRLAMRRHENFDVDKRMRCDALSHAFMRARRSGGLTRNPTSMLRRRRSKAGVQGWEGLRPSRMVIGKL